MAQLLVVQSARARAAPKAAGGGRAAQVRGSAARTRGARRRVPVAATPAVGRRSAGRGCRWPSPRAQRRGRTGRGAAGPGGDPQGVGACAPRQLPIDPGIPASGGETQGWSAGRGVGGRGGKSLGGGARDSATGPPSHLLTHPSGLIAGLRSRSFAAHLVASISRKGRRQG